MSSNNGAVCDPSFFFCRSISEESKIRTFFWTQKIQTNIASKCVLLIFYFRIENMRTIFLTLDLRSTCKLLQNNIFKEISIYFLCFRIAFHILCLQKFKNSYKIEIWLVLINIFRSATTSNSNEITKTPTYRSVIFHKVITATLTTNH